MFFATILDGFSRKEIYWDIRPDMKELDIEAIIQDARDGGCKPPAQHLPLFCLCPRCDKSPGFGGSVPETSCSCLFIP